MQPLTGVLLLCVKSVIQSPLGTLIAVGCYSMIPKVHFLWCIMFIVNLTTDEKVSFVFKLTI